MLKPVQHDVGRNNMAMNIKLNLQSQNKVEITTSADYQCFVVIDEPLVLDSEISFVLQKPNITSKIDFRIAILAQAELNLKIMLKILKGAKNTNSFLKITSFLLHPNAKINITPALEIMEDEVKAGHGATISYLDEDQMHYLQSRGIEPKKAEKLLIDAFFVN